MPEAGPAWSIEVDRELCMGSGMCIVYAPGTFAHDEHTKAVVVDPAGDPIDAIRNAVQACPTSALRLRPQDAVTGQNDENDQGA
jgi:ferredoxin